MPQAKFQLSNPVHFLALGFGSGLLKPAPGTWGTLVAIPIYGLLVGLFGGPTLGYGLVVLLSFAIGVYICGKTADDVGEHDHGAIVWDEIVGLLVTLAVVPVSLINIALGFLLFRFFDIVKPWPIKWLDKQVHGGFGIMIDDVIAGLFAAIILYLLQAYVP